ncbi:MAG UNVERIFIED_CONTAM: hypothetical protein LVT10_12975 [Anaerolineae bacterium]|jgi:esterase/lipase
MFNAFQGQEHLPFTLEGSGKTAALLVHGFPGSAAEMRPIGDILHAQGITARGVLLPASVRRLKRYPKRNMVTG